VPTPTPTPVPTPTPTPVPTPTPTPVPLTYWPMFGYDPGHTGYNSEETTLDATNVAGLQPFWSQGIVTETQVSSPSIIDDTLYVESGEGVLYALNADTGAIIWTCPTGEQANSYSTPAFYNNTVFVGSPDGKLYAVDAIEGTVKWTYWTSGKVNGSPVVDNDTVYFQSSEQTLYAIDATTGVFKWACVPPLSKRLDWSGSPVTSNGIVYFVASHSVNVSADIWESMSILYAVNADVGTPLWEYYFSTGVNREPVVADGLVYNLCGNELYAFDAYTGVVKWVHSSMEGTKASPIVVYGNRVYFVSNDSIYAIENNYGTYVWHADVSSYGQLSAGNGVIYSLIYGGPYIIALDLATGNFLWQSELLGAVSNSSVVVIADGKLYISMSDGIVQAFSPSS
ncbi:PQQ-binding-like beta-propeller repeat protein, partial [Chloroflexota bacterium]